MYNLFRIKLQFLHVKENRFFSPDSMTSLPWDDRKSKSVARMKRAKGIWRFRRTVHGISYINAERCEDNTGFFSSMARRKILQEMGFDFTVMAADIDEMSIRREISNPEVTREIPPVLAASQSARLLNSPYSNSHIYSKVVMEYE